MGASLRWSDPSGLLTEKTPFGVTCQIKDWIGPVNNFNCCEEAKKGQIDINPLNGKGDIGGVICCDGQLVSCIWISGGTKPAKNGKAKEIIDGCVRAHEDRHWQDVEDCKTVRNYHRPNGTWPPNIMECSAYKAQYKCLMGLPPDNKSALEKCGTDVVCKKEVQDEINEVNRRGTLACKAAGEPYP